MAISVLQRDTIHGCSDEGRPREVWIGKRGRVVGEEVLLNGRDAGREQERLSPERLIKHLATVAVGVGAEKCEAYQMFLQ